MTRGAWEELSDRPHQSRDGERIDRVVAVIKGAHQFVAIMSYLLSEGRIIDELRAVSRRGVRCYIVTAAEEQLRLNRRNLTTDDFNAIAAHQQLLDECSDFALIRTGPGFHAKAVLADGPDGAGLLSTANLRDGALSGNDELVVDLDEDEVRDLTLLMKWAMFGIAENEVVGRGHLGSVSGLALQEPIGRSLLQQTRQSNRLFEVATKLVIESDGPIIASSFSWSSDHRVVTGFCEAARSGREVVVIANPTVKSSIPSLIQMKKDGVEIVGREWMHAKAIAVAGKAFVSTANFRRLVSVNSSLDLGLELVGDRADFVRAELQQWADAPTHSFDVPDGLDIDSDVGFSEVFRSDG